MCMHMRAHRRRRSFNGVSESFPSEVDHRAGHAIDAHQVALKLDREEKAHVVLILQKRLIHEITLDPTQNVSMMHLVCGS